MCLGIFFLSYCCNLEESDSIYQISKTQEKVLLSEKSLANVLAFYSKYLCLSFHSGLFCNFISVPSTLLKLCLLKYPMTSICQIQGTTFRLWLAILQQYMSLLDTTSQFTQQMSIGCGPCTRHHTTHSRYSMKQPVMAGRKATNNCISKYLITIVTSITKEIKGVASTYICLSTLKQSNLAWRVRESHI